MKTRKPILVGVIAAAAVFVVGFGMLNVLYLIVPRSPELRGLYSYLSSSFGDAILLPLAAFFFGIAIASRSQAMARWLIGLGGALLGVAGGAAVQIGWLIDPSPQVNWTLIAPGVFNAAGWYHAAFLCAMSGLIGGSLAFLVAAAVVGQLSRVALLAAALGLVMLLGFVVLLILDNSGPVHRANGATLIGVGTALVAALAVVVFVTIRALRRSRPSRR